jgi:hypothetical protein
MDIYYGAAGGIRTTVGRICAGLGDAEYDEKEGRSICDDHPRSGNLVYGRPKAGSAFASGRAVPHFGLNRAVN